jgi:hypothetical protein
MIGKGAGPQVETERRLEARADALHAAVRLELGLAGGALRDGLSERDAATARLVVERTAARFEQWILRDVDQFEPEPTRRPGPDWAGWVANVAPTPEPDPALRDALEREARGC